MDDEGIWKHAGGLDHQDDQACEVLGVTTIRPRILDHRRNRLTTIYHGYVPHDSVNILLVRTPYRDPLPKRSATERTTTELSTTERSATERSAAERSAT